MPDHRERAPEPERDAKREHAVVHLVSRGPHEILGHVPVAPTRAMPGVHRILGRFHHDVAAAVPSPDDEHALPDEDPGVAILRRVEHAAGEGAGILRLFWKPVVAVGDDEGVELTGVTGIEGNAPAGPRVAFEYRLDPTHAGPEPYPGKHVEVSRVVAEILQDLG